MGDALAGAADELRRMSAMGERLQDALSPLLLASPEVMAEAQALDRIVQYAHDLAAFVERCGQACAPDWRVDIAAATDDLKLSELVGRLGGSGAQRAESQPSPSRPHPADAGELELW